MTLNSPSDGTYLARALQQQTISIRGARTHNLKNIDLDIPRNQLVVITGLQGASAPLPTQNTFMRLSWQHGRWQPAWDVLYTPADRGLVTTLSVLWTGEQVTLEAGLRAHGGPHDAAVRRAPVQRQAYVVASWAF